MNTEERKLSSRTVRLFRESARKSISDEVKCSSKLSWFIFGIGSEAPPSCDRGVSTIVIQMKETFLRFPMSVITRSIHRPREKILEENLRSFDDEREMREKIDNKTKLFHFRWWEKRRVECGARKEFPFRKTCSCSRQWNEQINNEHRKIAIENFAKWIGFSRRANRREMFSKCFIVFSVGRISDICKSALWNDEKATICIEPICLLLKSFSYASIQRQTTITVDLIEHFQRIFSSRFVLLSLI